jgi:hypothetical protein
MWRDYPKNDGIIKYSQTCLPAGRFYFKELE